MDGRKLINDRYSVTRITAILLGTLLFSQIALAVQGNLPFNRDNTSTGSAFAQIDIEDDINPSTPDNPDVSILSIASRYDTDLGSFHIIGELVNYVDTQVKNIQLNVTFYDAEGSVLGAATGSPYIESLRPQERSAFDIATYGDAATKVSGFSYYRISKSWDAVQESRPGLLDFDLRDITVDVCGNYHFLGVVTNYGKVTTGGIILSAAFYNDKNQITESALTPVNGIEGMLPPTKQSPIELLVDERMMSQFSYYSFNVQSVEYTSTVLEETNDPESVDYLDYQNGSPVLISSISQNSSGPTTWANNIMTVSTDLTSYQIGSNDLGISGMVPRQDGVQWGSEARELHVLVELMTASGSVLDKTAAPLSQDGSFSTTLPFSAEEGSEGQLYRIRAEVNGTIAETNFIVGTGQGGRDDSSSRVGCNPEYIAVDQLGVIPSDEVVGGDGFGNNTMDYYLEKPQIDVNFPAMLSASAENKLNRVQPITAVIQVFDADGTVVFIHLNQSVLFPDSKYQVRVPWTPDIKGQYTIESFVISGLDEPRVLSRPLRTSLNVV